jgi:hypothetical protein
VREFDHFGDCFCTCALIISTVLLQSVPHDLGDSALSTHPQPGLDPASTYHRSAGRKGRHGTGLEVFSPSHPLCHHGVRGWPTIPRVRRYSHLYRDRQNFTSRLPRCPGLLLPYKRVGQGSTRGEGRSKTQARSQAQIGKGTQPTDQHLKQSPLYSHFSFETWARFPLSQLVTPTQALRCKEIQYSPPPLDVGPSFARTRINPRVSSWHHHPDQGHVALDSLIGLGPSQDQTPTLRKENT